MIYTPVIVSDYMFFFKRRRRNTRLQGDWSSAVCSSDLMAACRGTAGRAPGAVRRVRRAGRTPADRSRGRACARGPGGRARRSPRSARHRILAAPPRAAAPRAPVLLADGGLGRLAAQDQGALVAPAVEAVDDVVRPAPQRPDR